MSKEENLILFPEVEILARRLSYEPLNTVTAGRRGKSYPSAAAPSPMKKISFGKLGWVKLIRAEYEQLQHQLDREELQRCIDYLYESCQKTGNKNRWKDFGLMIRKCSEEGWGKHPYGHRNPDVPKGDSGIIGEA